MKIIEKIDANVIEYFEWQGQNCCHAMGQYYAEDDWKLTAKADNLEKLEKAIADAIVSNAFEAIENPHIIFSCQGQQIFLVRAIQFVIGNGQHFCQSFYYERLSDCSGLDVVHSDYFKNRMLEVEKAKEAYRHKQDQEKVTQELKRKEELFEKLKKELGK